MKQDWSGLTLIRSLDEPAIDEIRAWARNNGVPILEINPATVDTSHYTGWYVFWTEVPLSNSLGVPLQVDDVDRDGNADVYGAFRDFNSSDFEARAYEINLDGTAELRFTYIPRPGASRLIHDSDGDSLKEVLFSLGGLVSDYEQNANDSLPTVFQYAHQRYQGNTGPGYTGIYLGSLDGDGLSDLLYKGSEVDSSDTTQGIVKIYVAEYDSDSLNFTRTWSTTYVPGWNGGIGGFAVNDFDGDGEMEFATADLLSGGVFLTENTGDDSFAQTWSDSTPFVNLYYLTEGDVDADGRAEFFVGATMSDGNWTLVFEADSNNSYSLRFLFHLIAGGVLDSPTYLTNDMDGDGSPELIVFSGAYLHVFKGIADNDYTLFYMKYEDYHHSVQIYDVSKDGIPDLLVSKDEVDSLGRFRFFADVYRAAGPLSSPKDYITPAHSHLFQNHPNPFNAKTVISYTVDYPQRVKLIVYDLLGEELEVIVDGFQNEGNHTVEWRPGNSASGVYFYRLLTDTRSHYGKMILLR